MPPTWSLSTPRYTIPVLRLITVGSDGELLCLRGLCSQAGYRGGSVKLKIFGHEAWLDRAAGLNLNTVRRAIILVP